MTLVEISKGRTPQQTFIELLKHGYHDHLFKRKIATRRRATLDRIFHHIIMPGDSTSYRIAT